MKKSLFFLAVAAVALASCSSDDTIAENSNVGKNQQKEIAFMPVSQKATRATTQYAIDGETFPTTQDMYVAAYQVSPVAGNYFAGTNFTYNSTASTSLDTPVWSGATKRYWPLAPACINFLAYANVTGSASFDGTTPASAATITQTDNSSAQTDLLYAIGHGDVTQSGNALTFPDKVGMQFQHAQAWVDFYVKAYTDGVETGIKVNSITLNGASYSGTYTITHTNYNAHSGQSVAGAWTLLGAKGKNSSNEDTNVASEVASNATAVAVPGIAGGGQSLTTSFAQAGKGLMIVPDDDDDTADFISFTINYTYDSHTYNYTFTPASAAAANVDQKKHYIYNITFKLHEIYVAATVNDWADQSATGITIQE